MKKLLTILFSIFLVGGLILAFVLGGLPKPFNYILAFLLFVFLIIITIIEDSWKKTCPACAEKIKIEATKCKHCGELQGE